MISILTVTKRNGWFRDAEECLKNQTIQDFEWIIVHEPNIKPQKSDLNVKWILAPEKKNPSNLNASLNEGLRKVSTDIVVFYQDFILIAPDTVENLIKDVRRGFVTTATINPNGEFDARYTGMNDMRIIPPQEWEANVAVAPMQAMYDLGGFEEELDKGWSWDNVNVAVRAYLLGYEFFIDEGIQPQLMEHPKEPEINPELVPNGELNEKILRETRRGQRPFKLNYL